MRFSHLLQEVMLLCIVASSTCGASRSPYKASVFSDLTSHEMMSVKNFLLDQPQLKLGSGHTTLGKNLIFMIELNIPKKQKVLNFLDRNGPKPQREARVVILFGNQPKPNITEFIVGPLPGPNYFTPITTRFIPFESRPLSHKEYSELDKKVLELIKEFDHILLELTGLSFYNCSDRCLDYLDVAPHGLGPGERRSWLVIVRKSEVFFLHPTGFEILVNHRSLNPEEWTLEKIWYNGQYFDSAKEFVQKYERNEVTKNPLPDFSDEDLSTSFKPRGEFKAKTDIHGPKICEPQGKRYKVLGNYVEYTGWSFAYRVRSSAGLQLFDIQYNNERIAYEVSVQEATATYSGDSPVAMQTNYMDSGWGMGTVHYELAKGIDCPEVATYLDLYSFFDTDEPVRYKNALCIFELPTGMPLRRHFEANPNGGYRFYAGVENHVLVVRTTSTVDNYDYIWDFIFYQNGVMETKVSATGYVHSTFFTPNGLSYGTRVRNHVLGNLHTHLVNYKVDLDVAGAKNSFESVDLKLEKIPNPWSPDDFIVQSRMNRIPRTSERQAAFSFDSSLPRYLVFENPNKKNKWGHARSYRIQYNSHAHNVLPKGWGVEKGMSWSRYSLAVTRHKDSEQTSNDIYIQCNPWEPTVYFENFIHNNESIVNQLEKLNGIPVAHIGVAWHHSHPSASERGYKDAARLVIGKDLVAWVTVGFLHIPHAEDIPNTTTPGNSNGFLLRPFNFFDEDPSVATKSTVIVRPTDNTFSKVKIERWIPEVVSPCVTGERFHYNGTYLSD